MDPQTAALEALVGTRDREGFGRIYDAYAPLLLRVCALVLRDAHEAEDVVQEVFTALWTHPQSFDPSRGRLRGYLCLLARSRAIDRLRRRRNREKRVFLPADPAVSLEALDAPRSGRRKGPAEAADDAQRGDRVRALLQALPPAQAQTLRLAYYQGLSQSEVAEQLGLPLGTVKTHMRRGLRRLALALQGRQEDWL